MASERIEKLLAMQQKAEAQKRKAEQQLRAAKHKISIQRNKERTHRLCERGGHLEHYLPNPELLTDEDVFLLIDYFFSSPRVRELVEQMTASRRGELPQSPKELIDAAVQRMPKPIMQDIVWSKRTRTTQRATEAAPPREWAHLYASSMRRAFSEGPCGGARCLRYQQGQAPAPIASATP